MIRLQKRAIPPELAAAIAERTERLLRLLAKGAQVPESLRTAYKHATVKELIKEETNEKCAYCESKIQHISFGDVEHIVPKSIRPDLTFSFENLTLACSACNNAKSDYFDPENPLINPYTDDPSEHLLALGTLVTRVPGDRKGFATETVLDLNRPGLLERRAERLTSVARLADKYAETASPQLRQVLAAELIKEAAASREYAFVVRMYLDRILDPEHRRLLWSDENSARGAA